MAKNANGKTKIELAILNPEKFQTFQEIRDFVTGEGAKALHFVIGQALKSPSDPLNMRYLGDAMEEARDGALSLNNDLEFLARIAVELKAGAIPAFYRFGGSDKDSQRRSLLLISLKDSDAADWVKRKIIEHLGDSSSSPEAIEATAHA